MVWFHEQTVQMRDRFRAHEAKKLFYWENQDYVRVSPEDCYATLLQHAYHGVLALVSNLRRDPQTVTVQFPLDNLGLRGKDLHVFDAMTNEAMPMAPDGKLSANLESEQWVYVWLRPNSGP